MLGFEPGMATFAKQMRGGNHQQNHTSAPVISDDKTKVQGRTLRYKLTSKTITKFDRYLIHHPVVPGLLQQILKGEEAVAR